MTWASCELTWGGAGLFLKHELLPQLLLQLPFHGQRDFAELRERLLDLPDVHQLDVVQLAGQESLDLAANLLDLRLGQRLVRDLG